MLGHIATPCCDLERFLRNAGQFDRTAAAVDAFEEESYRCHFVDQVCLDTKPVESNRVTGCYLWQELISSLSIDFDG